MTRIYTHKHTRTHAHTHTHTKPAILPPTKKNVGGQRALEMQREAILKELNGFFLYLAFFFWLVKFGSFSCELRYSLTGVTATHAPSSFWCSHSLPPHHPRPLPSLFLCVYWQVQITARLSRRMRMYVPIYVSAYVSIRQHTSDEKRR
jgi:hypothetical protein